MHVNVFRLGRSSLSLLCLVWLSSCSSGESAESKRPDPTRDAAPDDAATDGGVMDAASAADGGGSSDAATGGDVDSAAGSGGARAEQGDAGASGAGSSGAGAGAVSGAGAAGGTGGGAGAGGAGSGGAGSGGAGSGGAGSGGAGAGGAASTYTFQAFTQTAAYRATSGSSGASCLSTALKNIVGHEPTPSGTYPIAVYLTGTYMPFNDKDAQEFTQRMAARGFVAATVEYVTGNYPTSCGVMEARARCIFDSTSAESAITKLCARAKADCNKGIVTAGFSQGANLATLGRNYESRARAVFAIGDVYKPATINLKTCLQDSATAFTANQMRAVSGEHDGFAGGTPDSVRADLITVTGQTCGTTVWDCLQLDGSGWYMVKDAQVADGTADHCFFLSGGCNMPDIDSVFWMGNTEFSLDTNVAWLANRVDH